MKKITTIGVVGAGNMGSGIVQKLAMGDYTGDPGRYHPGVR